MQLGKLSKSLMMARKEEQAHPLLLHPKSKMETKRERRVRRRRQSQRMRVKWKERAPWAKRVRKSELVIYSIAVLLKFLKDEFS